MNNDINTINEYPQSKFWDMRISADEFIKKHLNDSVYLLTNVKNTKHSDGYSGMRILILMEDSKNTYIELGIDENGFTYEADISPGKGFFSKNSTIAMTMEVAAFVMLKYQKLQKDVLELNYKLEEIDPDSNKCFVSFEKDSMVYREPEKKMVWETL